MPRRTKIAVGLLTLTPSLIACNAAAAQVSLPPGLHPPNTLTEPEWRYITRTTFHERWGRIRPRPEITPHDLNRFAHALHLTTDQRALAEDLYTTFADAYLTAWLDMAETLGDEQLEYAFQPGFGRVSSTRERKQAFSTLAESLTSSLLTDLRLLLTPDQEPLWEQLERERRRARILPNLAHAGLATADLRALIDTLDLSDAQRTRINPLLDAWTTEIDTALASYDIRAAALDELIDRDNDLFAKQQDTGDDRAARDEIQMRRDPLRSDIAARALDLHAEAERITDLHRTHTTAIADLLESTPREDFDRATSIPAHFTGPTSPVQHSRFKLAVNTLRRGVAETEAALSYDMGIYPVEGYAAERLAIARAAEPLTADQQNNVDALVADFDTRARALDSTYAAARDAATLNDGPSSIFLPTTRGIVQLVRHDPNPEMTQSADVLGLGAGGIEYLEAYRDLELESIRALREILTLRQRLAIASF